MRRFAVDGANPDVPDREQTLGVVRTAGPRGTDDASAPAPRTFPWSEEHPEESAAVAAPPATPAPAVPPATAAETVLLVDSIPSGAAVTVDGTPAGRTPLEVREIAPGSHVVVISGRDGRRQETVIVLRGKTAVVAVILEASARPSDR